MTRPPPTDGPRIALLPWGHVIEDFLDRVGVSFESFRDEMTGGWMFGYIDALRLAGIQTVLVCVSARQRPGRYTHRPTGATIRVLRVPARYGPLRRLMRDPYGWSLEEMFGTRRSPPRMLQAARDVAPYLPTPLVPLARALRGERCSAVICQEYEYPRFDAAVLIGAFLRVPVFATFQGGDWQTSRLERVLRPPAVRACSGLVVATGTEATRLRERYGVPPEKIGRIFNPIDLALWRPADRDAARAAIGLPPTAWTAVWHGQIDVHRKGLDVLLDAWRRLPADGAGRELRLLLVGGGRDAEDLAARLSAIGDGRVHWVRQYVLDRTLMRQYLSAADAYVFPSRHEGFPVAPMEAMACGLPVVAANAPGVTDILEAGERHGGIVVPQADGGALAATLARLIDSPEAVTRLGLRARRRAEESFSLEAVGAQLRAFLTSRADALGEPRPA